jgi:predicted RNA-binding protein with PUA domain
LGVAVAVAATQEAPRLQQQQQAAEPVEEQTLLLLNQAPQIPAAEAVVVDGQPTCRVKAAPAS